MVQRTFMNIENVTEGMRLDQAIVNRAGKVLMERGILLKKEDLDSLREMGIVGVYISEGEDYFAEVEDEKLSKETVAQIEKHIVKDQAKVNLSESVKQRVSQGIQYLYSNTESADFADASTSITDELMRAINENDAIAIDIGALKISDEYTFKHSVDVATMSMIIGKKYGLDSKQIYEIGIAGLLHDIGKSKIPNEILNKPARLTDDEFAIMKQHSVYGYHILQRKEQLSKDIIYGVLQHHEKLNGRGYPMGVDRNKISLFARILSIADIYDALVTERPYKKGFSPRTAVEMLMSMTEELDIEAMRSFMSSIILYPVGSNVELSNGEKAKVVENRPECVLRPTVVGLKSGKLYNLADDLSCASILIL